MRILDDVKTALGISSNDRDAEIKGVILAGIQQMSMMGVQTIDERDPLTNLAIQMYCKANFNYQGDAERWQSAFERTVNGMAKACEYGVGIR